MMRLTPGVIALLAGSARARGASWAPPAAAGRDDGAGSPAGPVDRARGGRGDRDDRGAPRGA